MQSAAATTSTISLLPKNVSSFLERLRSSSWMPWKWTGSWTMPDYLHYLPPGTEYRRVAPGSQLVKAKIPHDHPSLVYDIEYFVRDHRRNQKFTARTVDAKPFDFNKMFENAPVTPDQVKTVTRPGGMPNHGY